MKKSLIALAALAAVSAASAQSSVTLYGRMDIGYGSQLSEQRGAASLRTRGIMDGAQQSNAIGFRGTEDLGGGLKANFVTEFGYNPTGLAQLAGRNATAAQQIGLSTAYPAGFTNTLGAVGATPAVSAISPNNNRQSYLGLSSASMGTVNIGYQYTNVYELSTLSGYNIGTEGAPGAFTAHTFGNTFAGGVRANGVTYISPVFAGGFTVRAQYGAGGAVPEQNESITSAGVGTNNNTRRTSVMGQYANGPLSAALSYTTNRVDNAATAGTSRTGKLTQLGASYDFGVAKVAGTINSGNDDGIGAGGVAGSGFGVASGTNTKYRSYQVGVAVPLGAFVPFITAGRAYAETDGAGARAIDIRQEQVGVRYSLSKRTLAYAFYGRSTDNAAQTAGLASTANSVYKDSKTVVGIAHSF